VRSLLALRSNNTTKGSQPEERPFRHPWSKRIFRKRRREKERKRNAESWVPGSGSKGKESCDRTGSKKGLSRKRNEGEWGKLTGSIGGRTENHIIKLPPEKKAR